MSETVTHELKTIPPYFSLVQRGIKNFELRKDDRGFRVGDLLWLREYYPETKQYSGSDCMRRIDYILRDFDGIQEGYCILSISIPENDNPF